MTTRRLVFLFLAALTVLRLLYVGQLELSPDEAYYFQWSKRLDWSYYSKGPGVAATIWLGTHLFGDSEFGVRVFSPLLGLGTSLLMFAFARRLYGESVAAWSVLLMNATPIFNVGSLVMTIDPLSIFFWTAALYAFWLALERSPAPNGWWAATGALMGLGFLAKYTNAIQALSILLLLALTPKYRAEFRRPGFYQMLGTFLIFTAPPIIWNAQHDWITVHHLTVRGGLQSATKIDPLEFLTFVGAHFGVYSPLIFGGMLVALVWGFRRADHQFKPRFLIAFTLPLFLLYSIVSFKAAGEANWTAPATVSLTVLAVALWHDLARENQRARRFAAAALIVGLAISVLAVDSELPRRLGIRYSYNLDPSERLRGWETAAEKVGEVRRTFEAQHGQPVFLIGKRYGVSSSLSFYLPEKRVEGPGHPPVYVPESAFPENQYFFWPRYDENVQLPADSPQRDEYYTEEGGVNLFVGRTALYITDRPEERPPSAIKAGFDKLEMIRCIDLTRRGLPLRQIRIFACYKYRQIPL